MLQLGGRNRIVFVDDRHNAHAHERGEGVVDVLALVVIDDVFACQQDLRDIDAVFKEHFIVNVHQFALADRSGGLLHGQFARASAQSKLGRAHAHRAGRNQHHVVSAVLQVADRAHKVFDAADVELSVFVCQRRGTHLDDDAADLVDMQHNSHLLSARPSGRNDSALL